MNLTKNISKILVANRSEIAIRVFRAATELGIRTVAIYAEEDKLSLHRFKADEAYHLGSGAGPVAAYLDIPRIIAIARKAGVDAIHPGYGFLSENPDFATACAEADIIFIGPSPGTMRTLGSKVAAREIAQSVDVPTVPASGALPDDDAECTRIASGIGYPLMLKASWGGGGRGMRPIANEAELLDSIRAGRREAQSAFGQDEVYLEKLVQRARHIEVQLLGDQHGNLLHLFERDCSIQRRNQKVIERAPAPYLDEATRQGVCDAALAIGRATHYCGAGTVEFLLDEDTGAFYFIEVNPRVQVEHTVTEMVTGIDIVKAQIRIAEGGHLGILPETGVPSQSDIRLNGHALQCRITTEDPENNFIPDYGRITAYRGAFGFGIRTDGGTAYSGAVVTRHYDSLLEKVTAWAADPDEAVKRMVRALREYRIRGVATNLPFLENVLTHPDFLAGNYTTRFIDQTPELLRPVQRQDRATRLLRYIADVTVNGHPDVKGRARPSPNGVQPTPAVFNGNPGSGTRQILESEGPAGLARWMRSQKRLLLTDTTMRDAHQSLLATRMRSADISAAAESYATGMPELFSLECWGGATFDVAMRFLGEDPWDRLAAIREQVPNILTQMLIRGSNAVGYTNYPDNVVRHFIAQAAQNGVDIFRVFDCFNWIDNMRVAINAIVESGKVAEGALCYTGDILDPNRTKYSLAYYVDLAKQLEAAGCHIIAVKDMAGLLRPAAAKVLIGALRDAVDVPLHLHTHDTSGAAAATILAASDAGVDAADAAIDAMSGTTSQPCLGSIVEALRHTERETGIDPDAVRKISFYWEAARGQYAAFESDVRFGASEVYLHEMPGGQFTNLKEQAKSLGLESRWHEVAEAYAAANLMFGDIVKVTPSSKVVGDMALMMVAQSLTVEDVLDDSREVAFPASVVEMLRGDLGQPVGGWPEKLLRRVLKDEAPMTVRPAELLPPVDFDAARADAEKEFGRALSETELSSHLLYAKTFKTYVDFNRTYGPVTVLPTLTYFYGMESGEEIAASIERGKSLNIRLQTIGETEDDGKVRVFFELNGQPRVIAVPDRSASASRPAVQFADPGDPSHVAAPMPGLIVGVAVSAGQSVQAGDVLLVIEAMKMETSIIAPRDGKVDSMLVSVGQTVEAKQLLSILTPLDDDAA